MLELNIRLRTVSGDIQSFDFSCFDEISCCCIRTVLVDNPDNWVRLNSCYEGEIIHRERHILTQFLDHDH